MTNDLK